MKSTITRTLGVSFAIAAALALPTAVKAQADGIVETTPETTVTADEISTESSYCILVPGFGEFCF